MNICRSYIVRDEETETNGFGLFETYPTTSVCSHKFSETQKLTSAQ